MQYTLILDINANRAPGTKVIQVGCGGGVEGWSGDNILVFCKMLSG